MKSVHAPDPAFCAALRQVSLPVLLLVSLLAPVVLAQPEPYADPLRFVRWPVQDVRAFEEALTSWDAAYLVGVGGVLVWAAQHDERMSADLSNYTPPGGHLAVRVVEEFGNVKAVQPTAVVLFMGALLAGDSRMQDAAFTSLEAIVLANLITNSMKAVFGRARPWQQEGALTFRPFSGNTSFPSGHSTTAFAFATPWLLYYPNAFTPGLVLLSTGAAFTRVLTRNHWFTDVVAGSAIGFTTAYALTRMHQGRSRRVLVAPTIGEKAVGIQVRVTLD